MRAAGRAAPVEAALRLARVPRPVLLRELRLRDLAATSQRADVGAIVFEWEQRHPVRAVDDRAVLVDRRPLCDLAVRLHDRRELDTHAKRLLTAQVVAVAASCVPAAVHVRAAADGRRRSAACSMSSALRPAVQPGAVAAHRAAGDPVGAVRAARHAARGARRCTRGSR